MSPASQTAEALQAMVLSDGTRARFALSDSVINRVQVELDADAGTLTMLESAVS